MSSKRRRPSFIVAWRTKNGRNQWEAVTRDEFGPFVYYLETEKNIPKASIHFHQLTIVFHQLLFLMILQYGYNFLYHLP